MQIEFGATAPSISEQLEKAKIKLTDNDATILNMLADAVTLLAVHNIISEQETIRARRKIIRYIEKRYKA